LKHPLSDSFLQATSLDTVLFNFYSTKLGKVLNDNWSMVWEARVLADDEIEERL
jgi:hypothetical protein